MSGNMAGVARTQVFAGVGLMSVGLFLPLVFVLGQIFESANQGLWILGIGSLVLGLPIWFLSSGVWAIVTGRRSKKATWEATAA